MRSLTLGMVNQRQAGYGISAATTHDQQLLVALTHDPSIAGSGPEAYTSICLNVDFPSALHADAHNAGHSWIVSLGAHDFDAEHSEPSTQLGSPQGCLKHPWGLSYRWYCCL